MKRQLAAILVSGAILGPGAAVGAIVPIDLSTGTLTTFRPSSNATVTVHDADSFTLTGADDNTGRRDNATFTVPIIASSVAALVEPSVRILDFRLRNSRVSQPGTTALITRTFEFDYEIDTFSLQISSDVEILSDDMDGFLFDGAGCSICNADIDLVELGRPRNFGGSSRRVTQSNPLDLQSPFVQLVDDVPQEITDFALNQLRTDVLGRLPTKQSEDFSIEAGRVTVFVRDLTAPSLLGVPSAIRAFANTDDAFGGAVSIRVDNLLVEVTKTTVTRTGLLKTAVLPLPLPPAVLLFGTAVIGLAATAHHRKSNRQSPQ